MLTLVLNPLSLPKLQCAYISQIELTRPKPSTLSESSPWFSRLSNPSITPVASPYLPWTLPTILRGITVVISRFSPLIFIAYRPLHFAFSYLSFHNPDARFPANTIGGRLCAPDAHQPETFNALSTRV
jgi:hypothetical protein